MIVWMLHMERPVCFACGPHKTDRRVQSTFAPRDWCALAASEWFRDHRGQL